jgi:hypothetical protein
MMGGIALCYPDLHSGSTTFQQADSPDFPLEGGALLQTLQDGLELLPPEVLTWLVSIIPDCSLHTSTSL